METLIIIIRVFCFYMSFAGLAKSSINAKANDIAGTIDDGVWAIVFTLYLILTFIV